MFLNTLKDQALKTKTGSVFLWNMLPAVALGKTTAQLLITMTCLYNYYHRSFLIWNLLIPQAPSPAVKKESIFLHNNKE